MAKESRPWSEGRRAWDQLAQWYCGRPGSPGDPLVALSDVGVVRRLLDEAELEAVREARRSGRSWAEIATKLGVTRQSAWERWRDLEVEPDRVPGRAEPAGPTVPPIPAVGMPAAGPATVPDRPARVGRRAWIAVPNLVGRTVEEARRVLAGLDLVAVAAEPDGPRLDEPGLRFAVVVDQSPESGARVRFGAPVRLWTDRGGGAGVREPRRPRPRAWNAQEIPEAERDEVVG